jgi:hypothetical protein
MFSVRWLNLLDDCDIRIPDKVIGTGAARLMITRKQTQGRI